MVRRAVPDALGRMGPTVMPAPIAALRDENEQLRHAAAEALRRIEP
jgi:HEAT repeat protein